ncbi:MAG: peptidase domain-containing ABC transporter, partial [Caenispirillum bisanense]|nr:peptidase domain-containing ABC transporter [Caenispirillum bisanense]MCA1972940.1 peptidase domain-containing ABC transporter [Caenispirillum sp.]
MKDADRPSWLRPVLAPLRPLFLEVLTISFFANVLAVAAPVFTLQVYDRVVYHNGLSTLQGLVLGMVLVVAFDYVLRQTRSRVLQRVALEIDVKVGRRLFDTLVGLPLRTLETRPASYWQGVFRDLETVRNTLSGATVVLLVDLPFVFLFVGLVFVIAAPVAWVIVAAFVVFLLIAWRSAASVTGAAGREKKQAAERDRLMAETILGRTTMKAVGMHEHLRPRWEEAQAAAIAQSVDRGMRSDGWVNLGHAMTIATTVAMTTVGALAIMEQQMTIGALIAANMLSGRMMGPMNQMVGAWRTVSGFRQSLRRLDGLFALPRERMAAVIAHDRPAGRLSLEKVSFRYGAAANPVVSEVSLEVPPGGITCLVGRNGSGKTTLAKLLAGLYTPESGRVLLDGADMAQFSREELARWVGVVPQDCVLFAGTIRDNIALGAPQAGDEEITAAAKAAGVHLAIMDMADGYATDVGEGGAVVSGGIRQRIAIARALVGDPPVIVMDEPSSNLDRQAEEDLAKSLSRLAQDRNIVLVTHSPALLAVARSIVVIERGRIAAGGPAAQVLAWLNGQKAAAGQA